MESQIFLYFINIFNYIYIFYLLFIIIDSDLEIYFELVKSMHNNIRKKGVRSYDDTTIFRS